MTCYCKLLTASSKFMPIASFVLFVLRRKQTNTNVPCLSLVCCLVRVLVFCPCGRLIALDLCIALCHLHSSLDRLHGGEQQYLLSDTRSQHSDRGDRATSSQSRLTLLFCLSLCASLSRPCVRMSACLVSAQCSACLLWCCCRGVP